MAAQSGALTALRGPGIARSQRCPQSHGGSQPPVILTAGNPIPSDIQQLLNTRGAQKNTKTKKKIKKKTQKKKKKHLKKIIKKTSQNQKGRY